MDEIRTAFARNGLYRSGEGKWLGGVCAGLGKRYGFSPKAARVLFVLGLLVLPGSQCLVYPALWILMPAEGRAAAGPVMPAA